jgi:hypothetical protein
MNGATLEETQMSAMEQHTQRLSEARFEDHVIAALAVSPLYRERPAMAFDPALLLDVELLLNGLPIVSVKLKNHFTGQNVQHAIAQYRRRDKNEPFWKRTLVHFAVDDDAAYMSTRIAEADTHFLPFNHDTHNPMETCPCLIFNT